MNGVATAYGRMAGSGMIHNAQCIVKSIVFHPDAGGDYVDIYDGRDATSSTKYCRVESAVDSTVPVDLGDGVIFGKGIYVAGIDSAVETTVAFIPL